MGCCCKFFEFLVKYVVIIFNISCLLVGSLLIVLGSIVLAGLGDMSQYPEATLIPILVITIGSVIFVVSFLGCCGAMRESSCMTYTYSVFMIIIVCCQLALVFYVWFWREKFLTSVTGVVDKAWEKRHLEPRVMDNLQSQFQCCGNTGFQDYVKAGEDIPMSCCPQGLPTCSMIDTYDQGCYSRFKDYWRSSTNVIIIGGLIGAGVELTAIILACCLAGNFKRK